jgi:hypothetical protein
MEPERPEGPSDLSVMASRSPYAHGPAVTQRSLGGSGGGGYHPDRVCSRSPNFNGAERPLAGPHRPACQCPGRYPLAATVLNSHEVEGVLGQEVRDISDENIGRIVDVVVDRAGHVRAAVIDFGGFLGIGNRKIAVDWNTLSFLPPGYKVGRVTLELSATM